MELSFNRLKQAAIYLFAVCIGISCVVAGDVSFFRPQMTSDHPVLVPPKLLKYFTLGYDEVTADLLWLRTIQDFDYCESRPVGVTDPNKFKCEQGWVFHMIDAVTEIAPNFKEPFYSGALMLTVIVNDVAGASVIFDKGVARYPDDWRLLYIASYQAMNEEHNGLKASQLLIRAGKNGAPSWVYSLAARLNEKSGQLELARNIISRAAEQTENPTEAGYLKKRLAEIEKQLAESNAHPQSSERPPR